MARFQYYGRVGRAEDVGARVEATGRQSFPRSKALAHGSGAARAATQVGFLSVTRRSIRSRSLISRLAVCTASAASVTLS